MVVGGGGEGRGVEGCLKKSFFSLVMYLKILSVNFRGFIVFYYINKNNKRIIKE